MRSRSQIRWILAASLPACFMLGAQPPAPSVRSPEELAALVPVKGGAYGMGDSFGDDNAALGVEGPVHQVIVTGFRIMRYEVSWALWTKVRAWAVAHGYEIGPGQAGYGEIGGRADEHPVTMVSWFDCAKWCNAWSEMEGRSPVYRDGNGAAPPLKTGEPPLSANCVQWEADGYRLPTEAEWEYAAREGGRKVRFGNGKDVADPDHINFNGDERHRTPYSVAGASRFATTVVGRFPANALGLFGMSGNVAEWCWDCLGAYQAGVARDPRGAADGPARVVRGGSCVDLPSGVRAANRSFSKPGDGGIWVGFRAVRGGNGG